MAKIIEMNMAGVYKIFCRRIKKHVPKYSHRKLSRHGHRTADGHELYPNDPYVNEQHFPFGAGGLTHIGKKREFSIGTALRARYDKFLGDIYYPEIVESRSTDYERTKMSLLLVLAGLFPPREDDKLQDNMCWQAVPYSYVLRPQDSLLLGILCPHFIKIYAEYCASPRMQAEFKEHKETFDYVTKHSGLDVVKYEEIYNLYFGLSTEEENGYILPEWTKKVWPAKVVDIAIREYYVTMGTTEMRKIRAGHLLKKMFEDTKNKIISSNPCGKKIYLYSAHENNIAEVFIALDVFKPHIPNYGAYAVIEIHKIKDEYAVRILYENQDGKGVQILEMPGCGKFCPMDKFIFVIEKYFPSENLCGNKKL